MSRKTHKQMTEKQKDDKLIEKLKIELGIEQPKQNKKYNTPNNKRKDDDK